MLDRMTTSCCCCRPRPTGCLWNFCRAVRRRGGARRSERTERGCWAARDTTDRRAGRCYDTASSTHTRRRLCTTTCLLSLLLLRLVLWSACRRQNLSSAAGVALRVKQRDTWQHDQCDDRFRTKQPCNREYYYYYYYFRPLAQSRRRENWRQVLVCCMQLS